ncbi:MAG: hypothetical protein JWQ94_4347 [Tardiphaga sp.]|jgi:hypothetical protein|nr:hypothetical protein [Tardiphaga sp.]
MGRAQRARVFLKPESVGTAQGRLCPPYDSRSAFTRANTARNIAGVSTRVFVL